MSRTYRETFTVDYTEYITEPMVKDGLVYGRRQIGKRRMRGTVQVVIDLGDVVNRIGGKAMRSKSGKSKLGPITVKRCGPPVELSRQMGGVSP